MLWRIECMVRDKHLSKALWLLEDIAVNMETPRRVQPVDDRPLGQIINLKGRKTITAREVREMIKAAGRREASYSAAITSLKEGGKIRPTPKLGVYQVVGGTK